MRDQLWLDAAMRRPENPQQRLLLDAAERVLLSDGLEALSVRRVTGEAGVNVATVNYAFGGKGPLLEALLERLLQPVTAERVERIRALTASGSYSTDELVRAYLEPLFRLRDRLGVHFGELVFQLPQAQSEAREIEGNAFRPGIAEFLDALMPLVPAVPRSLLEFRLGVMLGAVIAHSVGIVTIRDGAAGEACDDELLAFVSAGLCALPAESV
jgi:AcrR family transcriptional regulator